MAGIATADYATPLSANSNIPAASQRAWPGMTSLAVDRDHGSFDAMANLRSLSLLARST